MQSFKYGLDISLDECDDNITFAVSDNRAGKIIGHGGRTIKKLRKNDVEITVTDSYPRSVKISGEDRFKIFGKITYMDFPL